MFFVIVSEHPALVLTINVTGCEPEDLNVSVGSCTFDVPLVKVHAHDVMVPVATFDESVKFITLPRQALEFTKLATGLDCIAISTVSFTARQPPLCVVVSTSTTLPVLISVEPGR